MREALLAAETVAFAHARRVAFQDVDAAGIIFFARVLVYFHDAYVEFLTANGIELAEVLKSATWGAPIGHCEADFLRPLRFGDRISVEIVGARADETQATIGYRIRMASGDLAAVGALRHVFIDRTSFKRAPLPEEARKAFDLLPGF